MLSIGCKVFLIIADGREELGVSGLGLFDGLGVYLISLACGLSFCFEALGTRR